MYIEDRLFSENNPEEVLYSVTMTESEYALYSEFQKEFANPVNKALKNKKLISEYLSNLSPKERQLKKSLEHTELLGKARDHVAFGLPKKMAKSDVVVKMNREGSKHFPDGLYTAANGLPETVDGFVAKRKLLNLKNALKSNKFKGKSVDTDAFLMEMAPSRYRIG